MFLQSAILEGEYYPDNYYFPPFIINDRELNIIMMIIFLVILFTGVIVTIFNNIKAFKIKKIEKYDEENYEIIDTCVSEEKMKVKQKKMAVRRIIIGVLLSIFVAFSFSFGIGRILSIMFTPIVY